MTTLSLSRAGSVSVSPFAREVQTRLRAMRMKEFILAHAVSARLIDGKLYARHIYVQTLKNNRCFTVCQWVRVELTWASVREFLQY